LRAKLTDGRGTIRAAIAVITPKAMPSGAALASPVRFGVFELDVRLGELRRSGVRVPLQDQPLEILKALIERPGDLLTREELRQRLWRDDTFVDFEDGLNAAIRRLRDALGDNATTPRFIETLPRRGYRFIGPVHVPADAPVPSPKSSPPVSLTRLEAIWSALSRPLWPWTLAAVLTIVVGVMVWQRVSGISQPRNPTTRFALATQPLAVLGDPPIPAVALSRDGARLAYVAGDGIAGQLYLRSSNSLDAAPLPGADRVQGPFFSPDGNWIAFFSKGMLMKMALAGGSAVTVCPVPTMPASGGSWGNDGTIVFGGGGSLWRVPAEGGTPVQLGVPEYSVWPQVLPGDMAILFTVIRPSQKPGIWVLRSTNGELTHVIDRGGTARYVSSGHLVYAFGTSLIGTPFDLDTLQVTGPAIPVVSHVRMGLPKEPFVAHFAVSDGGTLAYLSGGLLPNLRTLLWVDKAGREENVTTEPRPYEWPRLSPDGSRVAVALPEPFDSGDVWIYDIVRTTLTKVTFDPALDDRPIWAPDGKRVIFRSLRDGVQTFNIFSTPADGTGVPERLIKDPNVDRTPHSISGNGNILLLSEAEGNLYRPHQYRLRAVSLDGRPISVPSLQGIESPTISPNGQWLAYRSFEAGRYEIYVRPFPDVEGGKWQISTNGGIAPLWSPDGRELFFLQGTSMMAAQIETTRGFVAGTPRLLFSGHYADGFGSTRNFDISPDGKRGQGNRRLGCVNARRLDGGCQLVRRAQRTCSQALNRQFQLPSRPGTHDGLRLDVQFNKSNQSQGQRKRSRSSLTRICSARFASGGICSSMPLMDSAKATRATTGNPPRHSGWEIHPVYSIEVCEFKTLATCRFDREDCGRGSLLIE
jgi:DNA-binding winged helix-turn-helix (wHTH) protein